MKKVIFCFSLITIASSAIAQIQQDFELPIGGSWNCYQAPDATTLIDNTSLNNNVLSTQIAHTGNYSMFIDCSGNSIVLESPFVNFTSSSTITFWMHSPPFGQFFKFGLELYSLPTPHLGTLNFSYDFEITNADFSTYGWKQFTFTPNVTGNKRIYFIGEETANAPLVFIDDIVVSNTSSINENKENDYKVFFNNGLDITFAKNNISLQIDVFNALGQKIHTEICNTNTNENKKIDLGKLPKGLYTITFTNKQGSISKKTIQY